LIIRNRELVTLALVVPALVIACLGTFPSVSAVPQTVVGPYISDPKPPISPWEDVTIATNITDYESGTRNVTLYYSTDVAPPRQYASVPMNRTYGNETLGSYVAQIPRQPNQTQVCYFTKITDGLGNVYEMSASERDPACYQVIVLPSSFEIVHVGIKNIDRKQLTVDLEVALRIYKPFAGDQPKSMPIQMFNDYWDFRPIDVPLSPSEKYEYYLATDLNGIHLIGDASLYPFDNYYLGLNFTGPPTATASMNAHYVGLYQYSDHHIWEYGSASIVDIRQYSSTIRVRIDFSRRLENAYYVILPLVFGFFILGATPMLSSGKKLQARLTTYLALFVFAMQYAYTINSAVPVRASGVTLAEIALISLACYVAIYIICSIVGAFLAGQKEKREAILSWTVDAMGAVLVLCFLFYVLLVRTPYEQRTLFDTLSMASLKFPHLGSLMIVGLVYGLILKAVSLVIHARRRPCDCWRA